MRICWSQYALWAVIAVLAVLGMLAGCGAKGDLYLSPEEKAAAQPVAADGIAAEPQSEQLEQPEQPEQPEAQPR